MKFCPVCSSNYEQKNDGQGVYHQCVKCKSRIYSFALLKRLNFKHSIFTKLLRSAKQNQTKFSGSCISCGQPYREEIFEINGYQTIVYVCPICLLFAINNLDLPIFKNPEPTHQKIEKKYSPDTEKLLEEMDEKISDSKNSWEIFDKSVKISKSKAIGFFAFMIGLILAFIRIGFAYAASTTFGKIFFIFSFLISMLVGMYFILGRKNISKVIKKYFSRF
jgi:hypothetical protein